MNIAANLKYVKDRLLRLFASKRYGLRKPALARIYRWSLERENRFGHAFILCWHHLLVIGILVYATVTVHAPSDSMIPWIFPLAKGLAALYESLKLIERVERINCSWALNVRRIAT